MKPGDVVTVGGEQVRIIELGPDDWIRVLYSDGDKVWTPPTAVTEPPPTLVQVLAQDQQDWPDGHPCRDCGQLAKNHPVVGVLECRDWR
jgi:hypothetical protein